MQKDVAGSGRRVSVSDPGNGSHAGSYPHACGLPAAVLYFRYDQDHERESCTSDVPFTSGAEKRTVGRTYETRLGQWKETGVLSGRPKLTCRNHAMPVFYRDVMYREGAEGKDEAYLKLYDGHDWKWFRVYLKRTDVLYETG